MKQAVTAVITYQNDLFMVKRQNYLRAFPGYHAFPGGKVDHDEADTPIEHPSLSSFDSRIIHALKRELEEEIGFDLFKGLESGLVKSFHHIGNAVTPKFNVYRFDTHFFKIVLSEKVNFVINEGEFSSGEWIDAEKMVDKYHKAQAMMVPPTVRIIKELANDIDCIGPFDLSLGIDLEKFVPHIEPIYGIKQFFPLSNTFPPANRTNCFLIGDDEKYLIDPSPESEMELEKFSNTLKEFEFDSVFLTHHHPDHHEFSTNIAKVRSVPMSMGKKTHQMILDRFGENYFDGIEIRFFKEGDILTKSLGRDIKVFEVPGHDEGQLALAPDSMEWFLVGDLIQTFGTVVIARPEGDMAKYFKTMQRVIDLNPQVVIPSHGIAVGGTFKLVETLKHRKMREGQIVKLVKLGRSAQEMLPIVYEGLDVSLHPYALMTIESHLVKIKAEGLA
ncbi:MAG: MBL fold metallo-hydrolase [Deltaproteobacteria bacterium]|nr:MAG: MBL fold metallo-hydrolase [Deltaproteobacteria bacterium]